MLPPPPTAPFSPFFFHCCTPPHFLSNAHGGEVLLSTLGNTKLDEPAKQQATRFGLLLFIQISIAADLYMQNSFHHLPPGGHTWQKDRLLLTRKTQHDKYISMTNECVCISVLNIRAVSVKKNFFSSIQMIDYAKKRNVIWVKSSASVMVFCIETFLLTSARLTEIEKKTRNFLVNANVSEDQID